MLARLTIALALIFFYSPPAFSLCGPWHPRVYGFAEEVSCYPLIVVEGLFLSSLAKKSEEKGYAVLRTSSGKEVNLIPTAVYGPRGGLYELYQIAFRPEVILEIGQTYELVIPEITPCEDCQGPPTYKASVQPYYPFGQLQWFQAPQFVESTYEHLGCGPEILSRFAWKVSCSQDFFIRSHVTTPSGDDLGYFLFPGHWPPGVNDTLDLGQFMCHDNYTWWAGTEYLVSFDLIDPFGQITPWEGPPLYFEQPHGNCYGPQVPRIKAFTIPDH